MESARICHESEYNPSVRINARPNASGQGIRAEPEAALTVEPGFVVPAVAAVVATATACSKAENDEDGEYSEHSVYRAAELHHDCWQAC